MNWRGRPLESHQVILETIRATTTRTGLRVQAELDTGSYPTGIKVTNKQMKNLTAQVITPYELQPDWNYSIAPGYLGLDHDTPGSYRNKDMYRTGGHRDCHPSYRARRRGTDPPGRCGHKARLFRADNSLVCHRDAVNLASRAKAMHQPFADGRAHDARPDGAGTR